MVQHTWDGIPHMGWYRTHGCVWMFELMYVCVASTRILWQREKPLVGRVLWSRKSCGRESPVVERVLWLRESCGRESPVVERVLWSRESCGRESPFIHLVYTSCLLTYQIMEVVTL